MSRALSDAIVFFGATGDLAKKQIFPLWRAWFATKALTRHHRGGQGELVAQSVDDAGL